MRKHLLEKYKGKSFAEASRMIDKQYANRNRDASQMEAFKAEMGILQSEQEKRRMMAEVATVMEGGMLAMGGVPPGGQLPLAPSMLLNSMDYWQGQSANVPQGTTPLGAPMASAVNPTPSPRGLNLTPTVPSLPARNTSTPLAPSVNSLSPVSPSGGFATDPGNLQQALADALPGMALPSSSSSSPGFGSKIGSWVKDNAYAPMAIGKGVEFLSKAFQLAGGYDTVDPELNPYGSRIESLMANRRINMDSLRNEALAGYNRTIEGSSPVRSQAVRQAIGSSAGAQLGRTMGDVSLRAQDANNQYRAQEAQALDNLGQQTVRSRQYAEQLNNQSKAAYQEGWQNLFESVGNAGQQITNFRAGLAQQRVMAEALRTKDFRFGDVMTTVRKAVNNGELSLNDFMTIAEMDSQGYPLADIERRYQQLLDQGRETLRNKNQ